MPPNSASPNELLHQFLDDRARSRFYGQIVVKFEDGKAVYVREERSWKPEELPSNPLRQANGNRK